MKNRLVVIIGVVAAIFSFSVLHRLSADEAEFAVESHDDRLVITAGSQPVASYVFRDEKILRPYFAQVHAPGGVRVTRKHPPEKGVDAVDHETMHPGLWLAFGDISGADFWRNKGRVERVEFIERPAAKGSVVRFAARYRYLAGESIVCREVARYTLRAVEPGYLITLDSEFSSDEPFVLGDQEEMGLGVRLATPLTVKQGSGSITNSEGGRNESEVWGRQADWCDYSGTISGRRTGLLVMPHPDNFRRSWMHVRDYGLVVANPFGQRAFTKGEASRVVVKPDEKLRLRFGVLAYATADASGFDPRKVHETYVRLTTANK
jgi:hypothetical protein